LLGKVAFIHYRERLQRLKASIAERWLRADARRRRGSRIPAAKRATEMNRIVKCTRLADKVEIYINLDLVMWLRWNEAKSFTVIKWPGAKENFVRVTEHPDEILGVPAETAKAPKKAAA
jgi:hypothetical protein